MKAENIVAAVKEYFGIDFQNNTRDPLSLNARWACCYIIKTKTDLPLKAIYGHLGLKDTSSAHNNYCAAKIRARKDKTFQQHVDAIIERLQK